MAQLAIGLGLDAFSTGMGLLQGHKIRAADATNENSAWNKAKAAYDQTVKQVVAAVNSGQVDPGTAAQYIQQYDQYIEDYLQKQVGKPGTAWNGTGKCDKHCTAGCCAYFNDIAPSTANIVAALQQVQQSGGSATANIRKAFSSKYGATEVPAYTVTFTPPKIQSISSAANTIATSVTRPLQSALSALGLSSSVPTATPSGLLVPGTGSGSSLLLYIGIGAAVALLLVAAIRK